MKVLVLDIETNLAHDTIWCCAVNSSWLAAFNSKVFKNYKADIDALQSLIDYADVVVGHNIIGFDGPVLSRVWGSTDSPLQSS